MLCCIVAYDVSIWIRSESSEDFCQRSNIRFFVVTNTSEFFCFPVFVFSHKKELEKFSGIVFIRIVFVWTIKKVEEFPFGIIPRLTIVEKYLLYESFVVSEGICIQEILLILYVCITDSIGLIHWKNIPEEREEFYFCLVGIAIISKLIELAHTNFRLWKRNHLMWVKQPQHCMKFDPSSCIRKEEIYCRSSASSLTKLIDSSWSCTNERFSGEMFRFSIVQGLEVPFVATAYVSSGEKME